MYRSLVLALASVTVLGTGAAEAQTRREIAITELEGATKRYITANGSIISQMGEPNADRLIGRAIPCRAGANASFSLAPGFAYPMPEGSRYVAEATSLQDPLTILSHGTVNGQVGAGPFTAEASNDKLTRLDISEAVRLSINTADPNGALSRGHIRFLSALTGTMPADYQHWCVITSASVWNVRYETYDKKRVILGLAQGLWIATAQGAYARNNSAVVPYQVVTIGITPYAASWVQAQADSVQMAAAETALIAPLPGDRATVSSLIGNLSESALAEGDRVGRLVSQQQF